MPVRGETSEERRRQGLRHRQGVENFGTLTPTPQHEKGPPVVGKGVIPHLCQGMCWLSDMVGLPVLDMSNALETTDF